MTKLVFSIDFSKSSIFHEKNTFSSSPIENAFLNHVSSAAIPNFNHAITGGFAIFI